MIKHVKQLAGDSLIYGISGVMSRMIGILLIPIYTKIFLPAQFGILNLINTSLLLIGIFISCGLENSVARWFYDTNEEEDRKKTFTNWIWFQFFFALIIFSIIVVCNIFFKINLKESGNSNLIIPLASFTLLSNILPGSIISWYRIQRKPKAAAFFSFTQVLLNLGLTCFYVLILKKGIAGVYYALLTTSIIFSIIALLYIKKWVKIKYFDFIRLKQMLVFSLPLLPAGLAFWLLNSTDAYFLLHFKNKTEVGLFAIGASLASVLSVFTIAFQSAWSSFAYSIVNKPEAKEVYAFVFLVYSFFMAVVGAVFFIFTPEILQIFTSKNYYSASWVAGILGYNIILIGVSYIALIGSSIKKKSSPYLYAMLIATVVTIVLDIVLIPRWGKEGSAIATLVAQFLVPVILFYKSQKIYYIPYKFSRIIAFTIFSATVAVAIRLYTIDNFLISILLKVITSLFILFIALWTNRISLLKIKKRFIPIKQQLI